MPKPPGPRCAACAEPLAGGAGLFCARCSANPAPPGLPARFAAYDPERRGAPLYHFFSGVRFFVAALPYVLRTRGVKRHIAAPIAITVALLALLVVATVVGAGWLLGPADDGTVGGYGRTLLQAVLVAAVLVGAYLLFFPLARVLLAPFADKISERVESLALGEPPPSQFELGAAATDAGRSLVEAVKMLGFQLSVTLPLLLVPVAGAPLAVAAGVFFNGLGAMDIAMGRKRMRLRDKLRVARAHLGFVMGLGAALYLVMLVPVVNLLAVPLGSVAATMGFLRMQKRD
jgi:CysZ protein